MPSMHRFQMLVAGMLLAIAAPARAADVDKLLPDDTEYVVSVNVKQIMESPLIKKHALEKLRAHIKENSEVSKILETLNFDPLKDLSSVTTAGQGTGPVDMKAYIIARGNFDVAKFESKAEEVSKNMGDVLKIHSEGGRKVYEFNPPGSDKPMFVGLIDKLSIVASTEKEFVTDSFDRAAGRKAANLKKEVKDLIEKVDGKQSLWVVMPGSVLGKTPLSDDEKGKKALEKLDNVSLGITIDKDVKMAVNIAAKSADAAKELAQEIKDGLDTAKGFLAIAAGQEKRLAPVVDLVGSIKLSTDGNSVTLKSEVSEELLEKSLDKD